MDKRPEVFSSRQDVVQFFQSQYVPAVSIWRGICDRIPSQVEGFLQYRGRRLHDGQLHEADYAECRLHSRKKDFYKVQLFPTPSTPWSFVASLDETLCLTSGIIWNQPESDSVIGLISHIRSIKMDVIIRPEHAEIKASDRIITLHQAVIRW